MKSFRVRGEAGVHETLHITSETEAGCYVRMDSDAEGAMREYHDFIPRHLLEALLKQGLLEDFDGAREAS